MDTTWHTAAIEQILGTLSPDQAVRGLFLIGSQTGAAWVDEWSDIDLLLVVADDALARFHPATAWHQPDVEQLSARFYYRRGGRPHEQALPHHQRPRRIQPLASRNDLYPPLPGSLLHLNGWLLRPGAYTVEVSVDGASAQKTIEVYSHLRKSSFKLIDWGSRAGERSNVLGEDSMGFNLLYAPGFGDASIRGGLDYMGSCIVSGGHQVDLRDDADWSDPYTLTAEIAAGQDPLTPLVLPASGAITPASRALPAPLAAAARWRVVLPDRANVLHLEGKSVMAYSLDGSLTAIEPVKGMTLAPVVVDRMPEAAKQAADLDKLHGGKLLPNRVVKQTAEANGIIAVAYWGGALQTFDAAGNLKTEQAMSQDISAMLWAGDTLVVATADGRVTGLAVK